jgi:cobalt-zinc-cadmium resistance protein CzcA
MHQWTGTSVPRPRSVRAPAAVRELLEQFPEVESIVPLNGRDDTVTDPTGYFNLEIFMPLRPERDRPVVEGLGRPRTKAELTKTMNDEMNRLFPGVD